MVHAQEFEVLERAMDYRVIRSTREEVNARGESYTLTNRYVEVGSSMHYFDGKEWQESKAEFRIENGMAVADTMPHKVRIAANLNSEGAVTLQTHDGKIFRSNPLIVAFRDIATGETAPVGRLQDSIGELVAPNQIVFPNAMEGFKCAIRFTISKFGFEQELIVQEPLSCEEYGLKDSPTVRLELWSAFLESPELVNAQRGMAGSMEDVSLDFGTLQIGNGKAFTVEGDSGEAPVAKSFGPIENDNRMFLVEAIAQEDLKPLMKSLKQVRLGKPDEKIKRLAKKVTKNRKDLLSDFRGYERSSTKLMASIQKSSRALGPSMVLDYSTVNGSLGTFLFQSDTTYYISADTTFSGGTVRFEGGAVLKYTNNVTLTINNTLSWKGGDPYRPVVLTAVSDHSVGEKLNTNTLSGQYAKAAINLTSGLSDLKIKNFRICNAQVGIILNGRTGNTLDNGQFVACGYGVKLTNSAATWLRNCLFHNVTTNLSGASCTVNAEHITADGGSYFKSDLGTLNITNSLVVAVTTPGSPTASTNFQTVASATGIFTTVGSASHYLATDTYRNLGNTNITLLADIQKRTTYPPIVLGSTISTPTTLSALSLWDDGYLDLGFHYDVLDFCIKESTINSTLLLTNGVALGIYGETGLGILSAGAKVISEGRPELLNRIVRYNTVQEQPANWGSYIMGMSLVNVSGVLSPSPELRMRFTEVSMLGSAASATEKFLDVGTSASFIWSARDCYFGSTYQQIANASGSVSPGIYLTNNIWWRPNLLVRNDSGGSGFPMALEVRNNLFISGALTFTRLTHASAVYNVKDNLFDACTITASASGIGNGNNGYRSTTPMSGGTSDIALTTTDYQTGPLGAYYYNSSASATNTQYLIGKGSVSDASTVGFYHYTTLPDQTTSETNTVLDIGFHYVRTSGSSSTTPKDTDGDGWPDYWEDINGNGSADGTETDWQSASDFGARIRITEPKSNTNVP